MAKIVQVILEDDIDQSPADETIKFGIDGSSYEIDLSNRNAAKLRDSLSLYIAHATKLGAAARQQSKKGARNSDNAAIRAWAGQQGIEVGDRGRIPQSVRDAYEAAH